MSDAQLNCEREHKILKKMNIVFLFRHEMDPVVQSVRDWTEATSQLLSTQSSLEQLSASDVDTIVDQLRNALTSVGSLDAISAVSDAFWVLLDVTDNIVFKEAESLELLQSMLNVYLDLDQSTIEDGVGINEMELLETRLSQLTEKYVQLDVSAARVLDGVAGHLLELVGKEDVATDVRNSFLRALLLLANSSEVEVTERLGAEYSSHLERLVDWLFICGEFSTQAALVELLRR